MIPELGVFALVLALLVAGAQALLPLAGAHWGVASWMRVARPAAVLQCLFVWLAFACLAQAFISNDFSVAYVAANSNSALPLAYRISALWGAHEGSLLLWVLILACWSCAVSFASRGLPLAFVARVLAVMGAISAMTPKMRATMSSGRWRLSTDTANIQPESMSTQSNSEPSWLPQVAANR